MPAAERDHVEDGTVSQETITSRSAAAGHRIAVAAAAGFKYTSVGAAVVAARAATTLARP